MNKEFHFYITYILSKNAGFDEDSSYVIAYSSQYVDDNTKQFIINKNKNDEYKNHISQTKDILKPKKKLMRIYPCFHFIPGDYKDDTARRRDGKFHILNTTPNSKNANILLDKALSSGNLYRIGIATHSFADTWTHQNFVGYFDYFNGMGKLLEKLTPNIGHADARFRPDIPALIWEDDRLISNNGKINNKKRHLEAAEKIFKKFKTHLNKSANKKIIEEEWNILQNDLDNAIGITFQGKDKKANKRIDSYKQLLKNFNNYDKKKWFNQAIKKTTVLHGMQIGDPINSNKINFNMCYKKEGFENSDWLKFQEAVKKHQEEAEVLYEEIFQQLEIEEY
jgi:hypothetical protein